MPTTTPGIACVHQWRRVDGVEVVIYALGLAMSGKNPTMPPRNSSELASDSVLSKRSALTAVLACRGCGVLRDSWKAWQAASTLHRVHTRKDRIVRRDSVRLAAHQAKSVPSPAQLRFCVAVIWLRLPRLKNKPSVS